MRMDRRAGLLNTEIHYPTLPELFGAIDEWDYASRNGSSTGVITAALPTAAVDGDNWYYFYLCGGSLEISKIHVNSSSSITQTRLSSTNASGQTKRQTTVSGASVVTDSIYAGVIVKLRFHTYGTGVIDYCLSNCYKRYNVSYYGSSSASSSNERVLVSTVRSQPGIILSAYRAAGESTATSSHTIWGVSAPLYPTTPIICCVGDTEYTDIGVWWKSGDYYIPRGKAGGNYSAYLLRSYAMVNLYEDW